MKYTIKCSYPDMFIESAKRAYDAIASGEIDTIEFKELYKSNPSGSVNIFECIKYLLALYGSKKLRDMSESNPNMLRYLINRYFATHYYQFNYEEYINDEQKSVQELALKINGLYDSLVHNIDDTVRMYLVNKEAVEMTADDMEDITMYSVRFKKGNNVIDAQNVFYILDKAGAAYTNKEIEIDFDDDNMEMTINDTKFAFALSPVNIMEIITKDIAKSKELWISGDVSAETGFAYPAITLFHAMNDNGFSCKESRILLASVHYRGQRIYSPISVAKNVVLHSILDNEVAAISENIVNGKFYSGTPAQRAKKISDAYEKATYWEPQSNIMHSPKYEEYLAKTEMPPDVAWLFAYNEYTSDLVYIVAKVLAQLSLELPKLVCVDPYCA